MAGPVSNPNLGLYLDRAPIDLSPRALQDGLNFRVKNGQLESRNLGWEKFATWTLDGRRAMLIDNFFPRGQSEKLIFANDRDLFRYDSVLDAVRYITPIYTVGTASTSGTAVTGIGTTWLTNAKPGDQIFFGSAGVTNPAAAWFTILTVNSNTSITLTASAGVNAAANYTIRRLFSTLATSWWDSATFVRDGTSGNDLWFATNGIEPPVYWDGTAVAAILMDAQQFTCKTLASYSNMMIYGNIVVGGVELPQAILNSDIGLPLNVNATGTGLSEQFTVHGGTDPIIALEPLGDYLVIYSTLTGIPMQFIGDPLIFQFRVSFTGQGPVGPRAIANFGEYHEFVGRDVGYMFDGASVKEINNHVWRGILQQADPKRRMQVYSHFDEEQGDLIWSVPANTDPGVGTIASSAMVAWTEHYLEDPGQFVQGTPFSKRQLPFTATGFYTQATGLRWQDITAQWRDFNYAWNDQFFQAGFPLNLAGDSAGQIWRLNKTQAANGQPLPSWVRFGRRRTRSGRERDLLTRIYPFARNDPYNMDVRLFMGDSTSGDTQDKGNMSYSQIQPQGSHFVTFYRRGRVFEVQFGSELGEPWQLTGYDFDIQPGGLR